MSTFFCHARNNSMHRPVAMSVAAAAMAVAMLESSAAHGWQCDVEQLQKLLPAGGLEGDRFGHALAMDGECMVIGAYRDDDACPNGSNCNSGSVHVFTQSASLWSHVGELKASDVASGDNFGRAVAISGNTMMVGSPLDDDAGSASGSAYIFVRDVGGWTQQAKLTAGDAAAGDSFGDAVAIHGDTAVVGALLDDHAGGSNAGSAYVFQRSGATWTQTAKLTASDAAASDNFGSAATIRGDTIIIGAENDDDPVFGLNAGSAYVYINSGGAWSQQAKLKADAGARDDRFGWEVAIDGDTAAVTALAEGDHGVVYIFDRTGDAWSLTDRLVSNDISTFDEFGFSLALMGDRLAIGCASDDDACANNPPFCDSGSVYLFERAGGVWTETLKLTADDGGAEDEFGYAVAMTESAILVGARMNDDVNLDAGAAYLFEMSCLEPCLGDLNGDGMVDGGDVGLMFSFWARGTETGADLNEDGMVNVFDLFLLLDLWGPCGGL